MSLGFTSVSITWTHHTMTHLDLTCSCAELLMEEVLFRLHFAPGVGRI
jgi:hypothetical protein